jgi:hypothetical protein
MWIQIALLRSPTKHLINAPAWLPQLDIEVALVIYIVIKRGDHPADGSRKWKNESKGSPYAPSTLAT